MTNGERERKAFKQDSWFACSRQDCHRPTRAGGLCVRHYDFARRAARAKERPEGIVVPGPVRFVLEDE